MEEKFLQLKQAHFDANEAVKQAQKDYKNALIEYSELKNIILKRDQIMLEKLELRNQLINISLKKL